MEDDIFLEILKTDRLARDRIASRRKQQRDLDYDSAYRQTEKDSDDEQASYHSGA